MRRVLAASIAVLAAAVAVPAAAAVEPDEPTAIDRATIPAGHIDIGPRFVDGEWRIQVRDDTASPPVWRNLPDVVLQALDESTIEVPDDDAFAFLGEPGASVWLLPQVERQGILWPGWNTQDPEVVERVDRDVTWTLHSVSGPGDFVLFETEGFGEPRVLFDSAAPLPQEMGIELDTHVHGNWAFAEPGVYLLDIEMSASAEGGEEVSARDSLRYLIGDGDPEEAFAAGAPGGGGDGSGIPVWIWIAGLAVLAILAIAALLVFRRRRGGAPGDAGVPAGGGKPGTSAEEPAVTGEGAS